MLSVIIPSYKDPLLHKTIDSILQNFTGDFEVIPVLDGYWTEIINDPRVRCVHLGDNRGMRGAINAGVSVARGKYLMRADEHCAFDKGFDEKMTSVCKDNWIMTARRYFLDPVEWKIMDNEPVDYEKLVTQKVGEKKKFTGYPTKIKTDKTIYETQAMQGSCWVMPHKWWDKVIKNLDDKSYGPLLQDSHEMVFKTWKAGGKLMVNTDTWFAHKHVSFPRVHNYPTREAEKAVCKMYDDWNNFYRTWKKSQ